MKTNKIKIFLALFIVLSVLMSMATLTVYASDERTVVQDHDFANKNLVDAEGFFTIAGSAANNKGSITYNGTLYDCCLKMESSTSITFTTPAAGTLKLVFGGSTDPVGKTVKINGEAVTVGADSTIVVENLAADTLYEIKKGDTQIFLYYISFTYTTTDAPVHTCTWTDVEGGTILEPTCTTAGSKTQACECGETQVVEIPATGHTPTNFVTTAPTADAAGATTAVCSVCEVAINYGATQVMTPGTYVLDASALEGINQGDYKDGEVKVINDVFAVHLSGKYKTESNKKEFSDGYTSSHRMNYGGATARDVESGAIRNAIEITTTGDTTIKIHWVCGETGRQVGLYTLEKDGEDYIFDYLCNTEEASTKNGLYVSTLEVSAGTYYIGAVVPEGVKAGGNYHYRIEVTVDEPEHVNSLVVGDTNKIVVSGNTLNDYNLPIEYVPFVATETANYAFVGSNGALAFIFDKNLALISATGVANLEAGEYIVCLGNGVVGEFNVAVTKSAWVNTLVEGTNKIYVDGSINNEYGLPIAWVKFTAAEKANYAFAGNNGALVFIFDASGTNLVSATGSAELEAGEYLICVGGGVVGMFDVTVTKTAGGGSGEQPTETPKAQLGDNTVTIDGTILNVGGTAIAWLEFVVEEAGTYVATSTDLKCYFYSKMDTADFNACLCGFSGVATLEPGTYYICVGNNGVKGEFTVNVSRSQEEPPHKNTVALGDNHYIVTDKLLDSDDPHEWLTIEITEPGTYVIKGGAPLTIFFFTEPGTLNELSPYGWNIDLNTGYVTEFEVELEEAGTYWMGFRYDAIGEEREFDFNISLKPHEHEFVEGKCECGETDPDYSWFDSILDTVKGFFQQLMEYIKNLFASFKKK